MKKTIIALSALSCLIVSPLSFSQAIKPSGLYFKGFSNLSINNHAYNPTTYGGGLGYKANLFRVEALYNYGKHSFTHQNEVNAVGYLDLDNLSPISPYVGLGVGYQDYSVKKIRHLDFGTHGLTPIGAIGARAYLTNNLALDIGYKVNFNANTYSKHEGKPTLGLVYHF